MWQGSAGDRRPYADQTAFWEMSPALSLLTGFSPVCDESFIGRCSVGKQELFGSFMQLSERYWF